MTIYVIKYRWISMEYLSYNEDVNTDKGKLAERRGRKAKGAKFGRISQPVAEGVRSMIFDKT